MHCISFDCRTLAAFVTAASPPSQPPPTAFFIFLDFLRFSPRGEAKCGGEVSNVKISTMEHFSPLFFVHAKVVNRLSIALQ